MPFNIGGVELALILVIVAMLFGVGKLPDVFGAVGKGIREFRQNVTDSSDRNEAGAVGRTAPTDSQNTPELKTANEAASSQSTQI